MATPSGDTACAAVGIDIGSVCAKVALGTRPDPWHGPTPAAEEPERILELLHAVSSSTGVEVDPQRSNIVVAVPDRWMAAGPEDSLVPLESSVEGLRLRAELTRRPELAAVRLASGMLCLAASTAGPDGCVLVCDVGASTVDAAVCLREGPNLRILDIECAQTAMADPVAILLDVVGAGASRDRLEAALHTRRRQHAPRARILLDRAARVPRYRSAIVYPPGAHGDSIDVAALLAALAPIAELTARVVERLVTRVREAVLPELVLTGGNAAGPVIAALRAVGADGIRTVRVFDPGAVATGALRIAQGSAHAVTTYPDTIGVASQRIRHGLLESVILPIPLVTEQPLELDVEDTGGATPVLRIRPAGETTWLTSEPIAAVRLPSGRYSVVVTTRYSARGAVRFRDTRDGTTIDVPIGRAVGQ